MRARVLLVCLAFLAVAACGGGDHAAAPAASTPPGKAALPSQILGLKVVEEKITDNVKRFTQTYLRSVGLFSFREDDDLLRATLQVSMFNDVAEAEKQRFRDSIVSQLGSSVPLELRLGDQPVFLATGSDQNVFSWFEPKGFFVLSVRSDYPFPRTLLRKLVDSELLA